MLSGRDSVQMDPSKWRISKACQECRAKKIRCDGGEPCQRCKIRSVDCVYRKKARNRARKSSPGRAVSREPHEPLISASGPGLVGDGVPSEGTASRSIQNHSVAATHRASPSMSLQLYYGPSSNFSILNSIYHQIEGTRPTSGPQKEVEEMGPGLDLFNIRRLYFGDLADSGESARMTSDTAAMFLDRALASRLIERYLATYWHILPIRSKDEYRRQRVQLYSSAEMFSFENPDTIIVLLAMAIGASMLEEEHVAQFLFQKAKRWSAKLDEMVNVQAVQIALLMMSPHSALFPCACRYH